MPNTAHYFLKVLQDKEKLLKYFTQNIDGLERLAGVKEENMVEAHGTFSSSKCIKCDKQHDIEKLREKIMNDEDPKCDCGREGLIKPNIVFFGEQLPARFFEEAEIDCTFCDLLICIGTSLEVYPFAGKISTLYTRITIICLKVLLMLPIM